MLDGSNDVDWCKDVPFGGLVDIDIYGKNFPVYRSTAGS